MTEEKEFGVVTEIYYPIVRVHGLPTVGNEEMVEFSSGSLGIVFSLLTDSVEVLLIDSSGVVIGDKVKPMRSQPLISFNNSYLGSIINPLGKLISGESKTTESDLSKPLDTHPGGISSRAPIDSPFLTGISVVDLLLPLGLGQKELVLGDRKSGKTSFLLSVLKNQAKLGTVVIYAAIGKKRQEVEEIYEFLKDEQILPNSIVVASYADDSPSLIYLAPLTAMSIAELLRDQGVQTLVVFDDLSTHSKFYREVSLLAGRFPGRESYPGDMFHVHARLLERAGNFKIGDRAVAISALPVAEVNQGDITSHIATNLMSITDGHILLDSNIFYEGRRPAVNVSLSITRVGRQAHTKLVRSINREVGSFLALYEKMRELSHFGAELTESVKNILSTGDTLYTFFEQERGSIVSQRAQVLLFALLWMKALDDTSKDAITKYRENISKSLENPENSAFVDNLMSVESLNDLLSNLNNNNELVKNLCK